MQKVNTFLLALLMGTAVSLVQADSKRASVFLPREDSISIGNREGLFRLWTAKEEIVLSDFSEEVRSEISKITNDGTVCIVQVNDDWHYVLPGNAGQMSNRVLNKKQYDQFRENLALEEAAVALREEKEEIRRNMEDFSREEAAGKALEKAKAAAALREEKEEIRQNMEDFDRDAAANKALQDAQTAAEKRRELEEACHEKEVIDPYSFELSYTDRARFFVYRNRKVFKVAGITTGTAAAAFVVTKYYNHGKKLKNRISEFKAAAVAGGVALAGSSLYYYYN